MRKGGGGDKDHIFFWRVKERRWMKSPYYSNSWVVKGMFQSYTSKSTFSSGLCCVSGFLHENLFSSINSDAFRLSVRGQTWLSWQRGIVGSVFLKHFALPDTFERNQPTASNCKALRTICFQVFCFVCFLLKMLVKVGLPEHLQI